MKINCPLCKEEMALFARNKDIQAAVNAKEYSAFECKNCNILFQYPFWKPEETAAFYESNYYAHTDTTKLQRAHRILDFYLGGSFYSKLLSPWFKKKLFPYYNGILNARNVLDIGCGKGLFLDLMKKYNKRTYGFEPSDSAKTVAVRKGHTMLDKAVFYSSPNGLKFDLITMFQVAEHLSLKELTEENIFSKIYNMLEDDGQLVIETPNYECAYAKKFKSDWRALELPRHLVIFSPKSISRILSDSGFIADVYTRISPVDVKESFKLKYRNNTVKNIVFKVAGLCKILFAQNKNGSLLVVVAKKRG